MDPAQPEPSLNECAQRFLESPQYAAHPEKHAMLQKLIKEPTFWWDGKDMVALGKPGRGSALPLSLNVKWYSAADAWKHGYGGLPLGGIGRLP